MMKKIAFSCIVAGLLSASLQAQEWRLGLGVGYRQFDDVEFSGLTMRNFDELRFILRDGAAMDFTPANYNATVGDMPGQTGAINVIENVQVSSAYFGTDESSSSSDGWAPVLTAEYLFMTENRLTLSVVANFQYFNVNAGGTDSLMLSNSATLHQYTVFSGSMAPNPNGDGTPYNDIVTNGFVDNDFSMDLYVLDLGLKLGYAFDKPIEVFAAVGPSLNIVDLDSSVTESAVYSAPGNAGGNFYSQSHSDGGTDLLFGVYGAIGGQWLINERVSVSLEARYDEVFDKAKTDYAKLDLSGFSGMAKVIFRF